MKSIISILLFSSIVFPQVFEWFARFRLRGLYIFLFAFSIAYLATPVMKALAISLGVLDEPSERKVHTIPTPFLGGLAIYIAFACAVLYNFYFSLELKGVALGATLVMVTGLIDDIWRGKTRGEVGLSARVKFVLQIIATLVMVPYHVTLSLVSPGTLGDLIEIVLTVIWVLGITNALNFFDGMDGLCAGLGAIHAFFIGIVAIQTNQEFLMFLSMALLGSCLGFLPYNFKFSGRAEIFLGDTGSTFIGFTLAGLAVMGGWGADDPIKAYTMPTLILGVLIFDMVYINISRILTGKVKNFTDLVEYTGKDHLHHRLEALGLTKRESVLFIYVLAVALGLGAIILKDGRTIDAILLLILASMIFLIVAILMLRGAYNLQRPPGEMERLLASILEYTETKLRTSENQEERERYLDEIAGYRRRLVMLARQMERNQEERLEIPQEERPPGSD